ncbi:MAG: transposase [Bacteroides sp.]
MKKERMHYDSLFKENAVKLSYERKNVSGLAGELSVSAALIYRWSKEYV